MAATGNTLPGTGSNNAGIGATAWVNPENVTADDGTESTCTAGASSQYLVASNFGFRIPEGSLILGVTVRIEARESSFGAETINIRLQDDTGALTGTGKTQSINGNVLTVYTLGSSSDLWGATLTPAMVNDADFGVRFWYTTAHNMAVDHVTMAIEYRPPGLMLLGVV